MLAVLVLALSGCSRKEPRKTEVAPRTGAAEGTREKGLLERTGAVTDSAVDKAWDKTRKTTEKVVDKTRETTGRIYDKTREKTGEAVDKTREATGEGVKKLGEWISPDKEEKKK